MKKIDNFLDCLEVLKKADIEMAYDDEIYRMGVLAQFNLTFELSWKALQAVLKMNGISYLNMGSPKEILKIAYSNGFLDNSEIWLVMLNKRNTLIHIYDEDKANEILLLIKDSFIPAFDMLKETLLKNINE